MMSFMYKCFALLQIVMSVKCITGQSSRKLTRLCQTMRKSPITYTNRNLICFSTFTLSRTSWIKGACEKKSSPNVTFRLMKFNKLAQIFLKRCIRKNFVTALRQCVMNSWDHYHQNKYHSGCPQGIVHEIKILSSTERMGMGVNKSGLLCLSKDVKEKQAGAQINTPTHGYWHCLVSIIIVIIVVVTVNFIFVTICTHQ